MKEGMKCRRGYHLKGTVFKDDEGRQYGRFNNKNNETPINVWAHKDSQTKSPVVTMPQAQSTHFYQDQLRGQILQIMKEMSVSPSPWVLPPVPPVQTAPVQESTTLNSLPRDLTVGDLLKALGRN